MYPKLVNSDQEFQKSIEAYLTDQNVLSMMILMAENNRCDIDYIETLIKSSSKTIIGGKFPKIIYENKLYSDGIMFIPLKFKLKTVCFDFNESDNHCYDKLNSVLNNNTHQIKSMFMFFDALSVKKDAFVDCLFNFFGTTVKYVGSACGTSNFDSSNCVISNEGFTSNSGIFAISSEDIILGASHGFQPISKPYKVTDVENNVIKTLDWLPAFEVYEKIVTEHSNQNFIEGDFHNFSKLYPLGKTKIDGDYTIRYVMDKLGSKIKCLDLVEVGEYVSVMNVHQEQMLKAANEALDCLQYTKNNFIDNEDYIFCIDCALREMRLEDEFQKEIDIIAKKLPVYGVLSLGEIINCGDRVLEIYNNMIALAVWK